MGRYPRARYTLVRDAKPAPRSTYPAAKITPLDGQVTRSYKKETAVTEPTWVVRDIDDDEEIPQWACQDSEEDGWGDEGAQR
jgi:hypothetical protein